MQRYRTNPIKKRQGYLSFINKEDESIVEALTTEANKFISAQKYTIHGLTNYLILVDRLGSLTDSDQYDILFDTCQKILKEDYLKILEELIIVLNEEYSFSNNHENSKPTYKEWENLFHRIQYVERFDDPVELLRRVFRFRINEIPILNLLKKIKPDVRVALFDYGINLNTVSSPDMLLHIQDKDEATFIAAYIFNDAASFPTFMEDDIANLFIKENWDIIGKYFFVRIFSGKKRQLNEETNRFFTKQIDNFLKCQFTDENTIDKIILQFDWPEDFAALGGWLIGIHENQNGANLSFNKSFINNLATSFSQKLSDINNQLPSYISNRQNLYHIWFSDVFDLKTQYVTGYIMWSFLNVEDSISRKLIDEFKNLCFEIKGLYYGSFQANHLAQKLSNYLLCLILSYPKFEDERIKNEDRLEELISIFNKTIGSQWVIFTERNQLIWKQNLNDITYSDNELLFITKRLSNIPKIYAKRISNLLNLIEKEATVDWQLKK